MRSDKPFLPVDHANMAQDTAIQRVDHFRKFGLVGVVASDHAVDARKAREQHAVAAEQRVCRTARLRNLRKKLLERGKLDGGRDNAEDPAIQRRVSAGDHDRPYPGAVVQLRRADIGPACRVPGHRPEVVAVADIDRRSRKLIRNVDGVAEPVHQHQAQDLRGGSDAAAEVQVHQPGVQLGVELLYRIDALLVQMLDQIELHQRGCLKRAIGLLGQHQGQIVQCYARVGDGNPPRIRQQQRGAGCQRQADDEPARHQPVPGTRVGHQSR